MIFIQSLFLVGEKLGFRWEITQIIFKNPFKIPYYKSVLQFYFKSKFTEMTLLGFSEVLSILQYSFSPRPHIDTVHKVT